jgi:hypothetical protein
VDVDRSATAEQGDATSPFNVGILSALTRHGVSCPFDTVDGLVS